jgi:hypothetical protein
VVVVVAVEVAVPRPGGRRGEMDPEFVQQTVWPGLIVGLSGLKPWSKTVMTTSPVWHEPRLWPPPPPEMADCGISSPVAQSTATATMRPVRLAVASPSPHRYSHHHFGWRA